LLLILYEMNKDTKACFALFQRLTMDNKSYKADLFGWIKAGLKVQEDRQRMLKIMEEEYMYLVSFRKK